MTGTQEKRPNDDGKRMHPPSSDPKSSSGDNGNLADEELKKESEQGPKK